MSGNSRGLFITFEGVEGSGKSTQIELLQRYLRESGYDVEVLREPGGTGIGEAIRAILLDPTNSAMAPITELLLYEAARSQLVAERVKPALDAGRLVLCDRFYDSTTAYQGAGRGFSLDLLQMLNSTAASGLVPDVTFVLDFPVEAGLERAANHKAADRLEREEVAFHERVRLGYLQLAKEEPARVKVIDASGPVETIAEEIRRLVEAFLER